MLRFLLPVIEEDVLPQLGYVGIAVDAFAVMCQHKELDVTGQRKHCPRRLAEHCRSDGVRFRQEGVTVRHACGRHQLDPAEQFLVLDLLAGEANQRFERRLVARGARR
jgi:hypothetical protein